MKAAIESRSSTPRIRQREWQYTGRSTIKSVSSISPDDESDTYSVSLLISQDHHCSLEDDPQIQF